MRPTVCKHTAPKRSVVHEVKNNKVVEVEYNVVKPVYRGNVIEVDGKEYIYNEDDGVYWLDGVQYSEYVK